MRYFRIFERSHYYLKNHLSLPFYTAIKQLLATSDAPTNVLSVWKEHLSDFCKFLSDEVETIFWESEARRSKLFKPKFGHRKLLQKWFWSYLELKNERSERLRRGFFSFLQIFEWQNWNRFLGKRDNAAKAFSTRPAWFGVF